MAKELNSGPYKIVSLTDKNPALGIGLVLPAFQFVRVDGTIKQWVIRKDGNGKYQLGIGGYPYTGVVEKKVAATINLQEDVKWEISHQEAQDAYTITQVNNPGYGWVVNSETGVVDVRMLIVMPSEPPRFPTTELFRFEQYA